MNLKEYFKGEIYFNNLGRDVFHDLVITLNKFKNTKNIYFPEFICSEAYDKIDGLIKIIFYHINPQFQIDLEDKDLLPDSIFVFVNYFGAIYNNIESYELVKKQNAIIVEDCTHSLGAFYYKNISNCYVDFRIFSLRKTIDVRGGAILEVCNKSLNGYFEYNACLDQNLFKIKYLVKSLRNIERILFIKFPRTLKIVNEDLIKIQQNVDYNNLRMHLDKILKINIDNLYVLKRKYYFKVQRYLRNKYFIEPIFFLSDDALPSYLPIICKDKKLIKILKKKFVLFPWPKANNKINSDFGPLSDLFLIKL